MHKLIQFICLMIVSAVASLAHATPVEWQLSDFIFDDGGTASGSFVFDADTTSYSAINITTTTGSDVTGASYALVGPLASATILDTAVSLPLATGVQRLIFDLASPMTNAGGSIAVEFATGINPLEGFCTSALCSTLNPGRLIRAGAYITTKSAISEPWTLALFTVGLLGWGSQRLWSQAGSK